jgi:phosphoadenosine phosphosulfate reductase
MKTLPVSLSNAIFRPAVFIQKALNHSVYATYMLYAPGFETETVTTTPTPDFDADELRAASIAVGAMDPIDRVHWARETFPDGLYATTSAGRDAALLWDTLDRSGEPVGLTFANTGFLHPATLRFRDKLMKRYGKLVLHECGPSEAVQAEVAQEELWLKDLDLFMEIVKTGPLEQLHEQLVVKALISAVRRDQTTNRAGLDFVTRRQDGTYRVHPFLDWTKEQVRAYIDENQLPRNKLPQLAEGVEHRRIVYINGAVVLIPVAECGLNVYNGKPIRLASSD